jgi:hypothetical protein
VTKQYADGPYLGGNPRELGITTPEEGCRAFLREFFLGQRAMLYALELRDVGYEPVEITPPTLQVIQSEGSTPDITAAFDQLGNFRANGPETSGFDSSF